MITGIFSEVLKTLLADADKAFSSGVLGKAIQTVAKGPQAPSGANQAVSGALPGPPARAGANVFRPAAESGESVPILKRILDVLESLARKAGILPRVAGAPSVSQSLSNLSGGGGTPAARHEVTQNTGGSAKYRFSQIARQLAGKPFFKTHVPDPKVPAGGGGGAGALLALGRLAGVAGIVSTVFVGVVAAIKSFVSGVEDQTRELSRYSGELAASVVKLDLTRMQLNIDRAQAIAPQGAELSEEIGKLLTEIQPLAIAGTRAAIQVSTMLVTVARVATNIQFIKGVLGVFPGLGGVLANILDIMVKEAAKEDKKNAGLLGADLAGLMAKGGPGGMLGGKVAPVRPPAFVPPMVRPIPLNRQNPGGK